MSKNIPKNATIKISRYIDTYYREYSIFTNNNRAIPSIIDGFKPVQRKILYCALKECRKDFKKVSSFAGLLPSVAAYHHGSAPAEDAIIKMTQEFNKNISLLEGDGTFGSRLVPEAGAARYIFSKLNDNFEYLFKDNEILPEYLDKDDNPEPLYYLPIIPLLLVNGSDGIAVGFSTTILPRSPRAVTRACLNYLKGKNIRVPKPFLHSFDGTFTEKSKHSYECEGVVEYDPKTKKLVIYDLPIGITHEKYIEHLDNLIDKDIVRKYIDGSHKSFEITVTLNDSLTEDQINKHFKLKKTFTENLCVLDDFSKSPTSSYSNIKIVNYDSVVDIIKDFCDFRLGFYNKRIQYNIDRLNRNIDERSERIKFIEEVIKGSIPVGTLTRKQLIDHLKGKNYNPDYIEGLISIPIYSLTKDNVSKYKSEIADKKKELKYWQQADSTDLYIEDLEELLKKLKY